MKSAAMFWILLVAAGALLSACGLSANLVTPSEPEEMTPAGEDLSSPSGEQTNPAASDQEGPECEDPFQGASPAFQTEGWLTNFCLHSVPFGEISSGGPPRDGIPPLDNPRFETVESAEAWIKDQEPVILFEFQGTARAYPLQIMTWHEIVNDEVAGLPVAVTFCPLCNTALVFQRPLVDGEILSFGTSGNLRNSDLVMWDRQTESWWQQFTGEAIVGDLTGTRLDFLPAAIISWADFKASHPEGEVLSIDTGFGRSYGRNPYSGYDNINSFPFAFSGETDGQLPPMARVVGVQLEDGQGSAYPLDLLREKLVLNEVAGKTRIALFWKSGTASALDSSSISDGRDVGTSSVFLAELDGQLLSFLPGDAGLFLDQETGTTWNILGKALSGPLAGKQLSPLPHHDTFWFAWAAFMPEISLSGED